jgi:hypothetical protein
MHKHVVSLVLLAAALGAAAAAGSAKTPFVVTSSLDGRRVLPLRSRWLAYPRLPVAQIEEVDFLIDGKVRWIEHHAPYNYGSDDLHGHLGYLITTWLSPAATPSPPAQSTIRARRRQTPSSPASCRRPSRRASSAKECGSGTSRTFPAGRAPVNGS